MIDETNTEDLNEIEVDDNMQDLIVSVDSDTPSETTPITPSFSDITGIFIVTNFINPYSVFFPKVIAALLWR